jgi:hypothetical protein
MSGLGKICRNYRDIIALQTEKIAKLERERDILEKGIQDVIDNHSPALAVETQVKLKGFREGKWE